MARLQDKVIIITGAAQGMGETHARLCLEEGAKVVLTDINSEKGDALAKELGDNALFIKHDVTNEDDWAQVVKATQEKFGQINVLVNNAGITTHKSILDTSVEDYRKILEINQVSVFLGMKAVSASTLTSNGAAMLGTKGMQLHCLAIQGNVAA